jgi:hypothetical protein
MSAFEEIQQLCKKWSEDEHNYLIQSAEFARRFANGFREHIGAPEHYLDLNRQATKEYVELRKIIRNSAGEEEVVLPKHGTDVLTRQDDGGFLFGVRFVVDSATNAFPKQFLTYVVRFRIVEAVCEMKVAGESFSFEVRDNSARAPVYDHMVAVLKKELERKPWNGAQTQTIGFLSFAG